jgi:16S rRNA (guanine527-N7)-methyltransferase
MEMANFCETLHAGAEAIGVPLTEEQVAQCLAFAHLVLAENAVQNLTRIVAPTEMAIKHFVDSLTVFRAVPDLPQNARVVDVGTGAGFPGVVLKIYRPDIALTLLDSLRKRLTFLERAASELHLESVTCLHTRAEDTKQTFDLVTARAVAPLPKLLTWCAPLVAKNGLLVAMKTDTVEAEKQDAAPLLKSLRLQEGNDLALTLPDGAGNRRLVVYGRSL